MRLLALANVVLVLLGPGLASPPADEEAAGILLANDSAAASFLQNWILLQSPQAVRPTAPGLQQVSQPGQGERFAPFNSLLAQQQLKRMAPLQPGLSAGPMPQQVLRPAKPADAATALLREQVDMAQEQLGAAARVQEALAAQRSRAGEAQEAWSQQRAAAVGFGNEELASAKEGHSLVTAGQAPSHGQTASDAWWPPPLLDAEEAATRIQDESALPLLLSERASHRADAVTAVQTSVQAKSVHAPKDAKVAVAQEVPRTRQAQSDEREKYISESAPPAEQLPAYASMQEQHVLSVQAASARLVEDMERHERELESQAAQQLQEARSEVGQILARLQQTRAQMQEAIAEAIAAEKGSLAVAQAAQAVPLMAGQVQLAKSEQHLQGLSGAYLMEVPH